MNLQFWTDLSLVYLTIMQFVVTIATAVLLYFVVRGIIIARRKITQGVQLARYYMGIVRVQTGKYADKAAEPLVLGHAEAARDAAIVRSLIPGRQAAASQSEQTKEKSA